MAFNNKPPPLSLLSDSNNRRQQQQQTTVPPSPTFSTNSILSTTSLLSSFSWIADKTPQDLIPMLKNAYTALKQKEEDLTLAAEIGKQLLNANVQLENNYNQLLNSVQQKNNNNEGELIQPNISESSEDDYDNDDEYPEMRFIPSTNARQAMIEVLEMKNTELTEKLEGLLNEKDEMKNSNSQRTKDLEKEILALKSDLDMAANKIHELEDMNKRQLNPSLSTTSNGSRLKKKKRINANGDLESDSEDDDDEMNELLNDMEKLQKDHHQVLNAKNVLENKLKMALSDLSQLKQQFEQFEFTEAGFKQLQETYDRQFQHISELNASLEEHRFTLQKLKDRGIQIHSLNSTPCPSEIFNRDDDHHSTPRKHSNLLSELEIEWIKKQKNNNNHNQPSTSKKNVYLQQDNQSQNTFNFPPPPSSSKSSSNLSMTSSQIHREFFQMDSFETLMKKASGVDSNYIDDALSLIYELEQGIDKSGYSPFGDYHQQDNDDDDDDYMFNPASISAVGNDHQQHLLRHRSNNNDGPSSIASLPLISSNSNNMLIEYPGRDIYPNLDHNSQASTITKYDPSMNKHGLIRKWIMKAFHRVWRWFRFTIVLSTAIMISLWAGPDDLLLTMDD